MLRFMVAFTKGRRMNYLGCTVVNILGTDYPSRGFSDNDRIIKAMIAGGIKEAPLYRDGEWLEANIRLVRTKEGHYGLQTCEASVMPENTTVITENTIEKRQTVGFEGVHERADRGTNKDFGGGFV